MAGHALQVDPPGIGNLRVGDVGQHLQHTGPGPVLVQRREQPEELLRYDVLPERLRPVA